MNLKQIETFFWVGRLGSFQAAADRLNTTQPGISNRVRELERTLGVVLFDRSGRSARLTPHGRELMISAERMLTLAKDIEERLGRSGAVTGLVRVGVADTIALTWLPDLVARIAEDFPGLAIELEVGLSVDLLAQLQERRVDLALVVGPVALPGMECRPLWDVDIRWMASPGLAVPAGRATAEDLVDLPIISHTIGSHQHLTIVQWFREAGLVPRRISSCSSLATIIKMASAGLGLCILSPVTLTREIAAGHLAVVETDRPLPPNRFVAVYPDQAIQKAPRMIAALAQEVARRWRSDA
ncbi:MAG: LysR family transcriptional regulator [Azospirillaceae bacterium]